MPPIANFLLIFRFGLTGFAPSSFGFSSVVGAGGAIGSKVGKPVETSLNGSLGAGVGTSGKVGGGGGGGGAAGVSKIGGKGGNPTPPLGWFP
ncbi:MAG: hypothetical protein AAB548_01645 [Patescibacteria group bacterium]